MKTQVRRLSLSLCTLMWGCGQITVADLDGQSVAAVGLGDAAWVASPIQLRVQTSKCVDVRAASPVNGTPVQIYDCNGTAAQSWALTSGTLRVLGSKCLDITGGANQNGTRVQIWDCSASNGNQQWTVNGGLVQWTGTNKCLDLTNGNAANGTQLQIWDCNAASNSQLWLSNFGGAPPPSLPITGIEVAPYFMSWGYNNGSYKVTGLVDARKKTGLKSATFAFEISGGGCNASGDIDGMLADVKGFIGGGGHLIISFGGAAGPFLESTCSSASSIANAIDGVMRRAGTHLLDFDVEGGALGDAGANSRRVAALQILQNKDADLYVSYTLPVDAQGGLPAEAVSLLRANAAAGIRVSRVNIMTMDYGYTLPAKTQGDMAISATEATVAQLRGVYPGKADSALYNLIGITPMIGRNDDGNVFTVSDAKKVAQYAKQKGVGLLSFWALQRDQTGNGNYNDYSQAQTADFEFLRAFQAVQ